MIDRGVIPCGNLFQNDMMLVCSRAVWWLAEIIRSIEAMRSYRQGRRSNLLVVSSCKIGATDIASNALYILSIVKVDNIGVVHGIQLASDKR